MENYIWPEISKDTPIEEVKRIHQKIWDYVIEHGEKPDTPYTFDCVACEYASLKIDTHKMVDVIDDFKNHYEAHNFCYNCPIKWPNNQWCPSLDSIFRKWFDENGPSNMANIAKQIRDLPWKFEVGEDEA